MKRLESEGKLEPGLTSHGLRRTTGAAPVEAGVELDVVRRRLGQKTLAMAIHYSQSASAERNTNGHND